MQTALWIGIYLAKFFSMEFMAWFTHKYVMHGFLWHIHADHHKKDHDSWFERNDLFFIFYAVVSMGCIILWSEYGVWFALPIGIGIFSYGLAYFMVHDIFIHQRFKIFKKADNIYAKGIRRAHKIHHKHIGKKEGGKFRDAHCTIQIF